MSGVLLRRRCLHTATTTTTTIPIDDFLSRFTSTMRTHIRKSNPDLDRATRESLLLSFSRTLAASLSLSTGPNISPLTLAAADPNHLLSPHLYTAAVDVASSALESMRRDRKRNLMRHFLHSEDVKAMCRFAAEVGIRGEMMKEFRFKWAEEEMEEWEAMQGLGRREEVERSVEALPERKGRIGFAMYGLDLSGERWAEAAETIEEPEKRKPVVGECRAVMERIVGLKVEEEEEEEEEEGELVRLLKEWKDLLKPRRVDWDGLLCLIKYYNPALYFKVAELLLDEESFQTDIRDYSSLTDAHVKADRLDMAERTFQKMTEKGIKPDILTSIILVDMYCKTGNLARAEEEFNSLKKQDFQPNHKVYKAMIKAHLQAGQAKDGEKLLSDMELLGMKPPKEIYIELLRSFSEHGQCDEAKKTFNRMTFAGIQCTLEANTLLIEAFEKRGDFEEARKHFDNMISSGTEPDDRCTSSIISSYEKKNLLDKALELLLDREKDGFRPGIATYAVLVDWFGKLLLVEEVEQLVEKITHIGDPPSSVRISLCDMYARAGFEDKAQKHLGILLEKKETMSESEFERIVNGFLEGGFVGEAKRIIDIMKGLGLDCSERTKVALMSAETIPTSRRNSK